MKKIGVIGMGTMGAPMAVHLVEAGFDVCVYNRTAQKCQRAADAGARVADTIAQLVSDADAVVIVVADDEAVRQIITGDGGVLETGRAGLIVIDSTTVHPDTSRQMAEALAAKQITFLDAPVTGSRNEAESGNLSFWVGGDRVAYEKCAPLFEAMGKAHMHLGGSGMGACAKVGNNLMGQIHLAALSEAMTMVERYGLDRELFFKVISQSGARSAVVDGKGPKILNDDYTPHFSLTLAVKDITLANQLADGLGHHLPVAAATRKVYAQAAETHGDEDLCSLYRWYREQKQP
jgi:3-hydroxyisobutyrate dehydrogenase-like beta-hydroxyacid dehydrogenase